MASTRNKNTIADYKLEKRANDMASDYLTYKYYGKPYQLGIPSLGSNPSYMSRENLSLNSVDIESSLFGIGANNLVNPQPEIKPYLTPINEVHFFKQKDTIYMPEKFYIQPNQRPQF